MRFSQSSLQSISTDGTGGTPKSTQTEFGRRRTCSVSDDSPDGAHPSCHLCDHARVGQNERECHSANKEHGRNKMAEVDRSARVFR